MPKFDDDKRESALRELRAVFKTVSSQKGSFLGDARANEVSRAEFKKLNWADLEKIMGKDIMRERFPDAGNNLDAAWLLLDTNKDSSITPEEFFHECLNETYCSHVEAMEAYDILRDQNEELPVADLGNAIRAIGLNPTEQQVQEMIIKYDTNSDGVLDREEWSAIVDDMMKFPKDDRKTLLNAFEKVSKGKGKGVDSEISTDELCFVATKLGHGLDAAEVKAMIDVVDANKDGDVQFGEFVDMVQKLPAYASGEI